MVRRPESTTLGLNRFQGVRPLAGQGRCLTAMRRHGEAETALIEACGILQPALGAADEQCVTAVRALVNLYEAWGKPDQAAEWRAKLPSEDQPE